MALINCKTCGGFVIEDDLYIYTQEPTVEFVCLMCGRHFEFSTERYRKLLDALKVNYKERIKVGKRPRTNREAKGLRAVRHS